MKCETFTFQSHVPASPQAVYDWHSRPGALERLLPPWKNIELRAKQGGLEPGTEVDLAIRLGFLRLRWRARHGECQPGRYFTDAQVNGPFRSWEHRHEFTSDGAGGCWMEDRVVYALPMGWLGWGLAGWFVRRDLRRMFSWRHRIVAADFASDRCYAVPKMKVMISGAGGLVGTALSATLSQHGHEITPLQRRAAAAGSPGGPWWDPRSGQIDLQGAGPVDAIVHLAGENLAGRWTQRKKEAIWKSRVEGTRLLCTAIARMPQPPSVLVSASAVGIYGDRGDELLDEESKAGHGFLSDLAKEWEAATAPVRERGIRVVHARLGIVLTPRGGALARLLPVFQLGLGGPVGNGRQYWSWVGLDDAVAALERMLVDRAFAGAYNVVTPHPVTNSEFTRILGRVLHRPAVLRIPAPLVRLGFGEMGEAMLLSGARVLPRRLEQSGFVFHQPTLESALRHLLGRSEGKTTRGGNA